MLKSELDNKYLDKIHDLIERCSDTQTAVEAMRDFYHLSNVTYHLAQTVAGNVDFPYVRSTYPEKWLARYLIRGYVRVDLVVTQGFQRQFPFDWSEIDPTPQGMELMRDAVLHGVGSSGFSIPITDRVGRKALLSVNDHRVGTNWSHKVHAERDEWVEVANELHRKAIIELYGEHDPSPTLSPREIECLQWASQGKEYTDIARILGISEHTIRSYLKSARFKLNCGNITNAVTKAIKLRLINP